MCVRARARDKEQVTAWRAAFFSHAVAFFFLMASYAVISVRYVYRQHS